MVKYSAAGSTVAGSNPGKVNQVNRVSSSVASIVASCFCAIMHVPSNSLMMSVQSSLEPGGDFCLKVVPNAGSTNVCSRTCSETK